MMLIWSSFTFTRLQLKIFTVRNSSCGKVVFSQACVKNSLHGEGAVSSPLHAGIHTTSPPTCSAPPGQTPSSRPRLPRWPLQRTVWHPTGMHSCLAGILMNRPLFRFWLTLLTDALPLLEADDVIFSSQQTYELLHCLEELNNTEKMQIVTETGADQKDSDKNTKMMADKNLQVRVQAK